MKTTDFININEYLDRKSIGYREVGGELIAGCVFGDCDRDSSGNEGHLYFNPTTSQYHCKKCGVSGNIVTLAKHLGDPVASVMAKPRAKQPSKFGPELVDYCHSNMPDRIRKYLNNRGIPDELIAMRKLGYGYFNHRYWVTIPVYASDGKPMYLKLRQDPDNGAEKMTWPGGAAGLYNGQIINDKLERLVVCEGELDCLAATAKGITAVTSTHGAMSFRTEWLDGVRKDLPLYLCFDNDSTGYNAAIKHAQALFKAGFTAVNIIALPEEVGDKGDLTNYFVKLEGKPEDLFTAYAAPYPPRIDTSRFREMGFEDIAKVLDLTIVDDNINKVIAFLAMLSAYTPDSQLNVSFNAPSSSGKTYIILEVSKLFPLESMLKLARCTAAAIYHDVGEYDEETNTHVINFEGKVLIFLDQPDQSVMARLRTLLSHDDKELQSKITDKSERFGHRTKNVRFIGSPAVIYCTAGQLMDEQEATRFIILSPENNEERLRRSVRLTLDRHSNPEDFTKMVEGHPERILLKQRVQAIKFSGVSDIMVPEELKEAVFEEFTGSRGLKPRDNRDIQRVLSFAKIFAILNLWHRERQGDKLVVAEWDVVQALKLWKAIAETQDKGIAPFVLEIFNSVIKPIFIAKNKDNASSSPVGLGRQEICQQYSWVNGQLLSEDKLRQVILPPLERAGLIYQETDVTNSRRKLVFLPEKATCEPDRGVTVTTILKPIEGAKDERNNQNPTKTTDLGYPDGIGDAGDSGQHPVLLGQPEESAVC